MYDVHQSIIHINLSSNALQRAKEEMSERSEKNRYIAITNRLYLEQNMNKYSSLTHFISSSSPLRAKKNCLKINRQIILFYFIRRDGKNYI